MADSARQKYFVSTSQRMERHHAHDLLREQVKVLERVARHPDVDTNISEKLMRLRHKLRRLCDRIVDDDHTKHASPEKRSKVRRNLSKKRAVSRPSTRKKTKRVSTPALYSMRTRSMSKSSRKTKKNQKKRDERDEDDSD